MFNAWWPITTHGDVPGSSTNYLSHLCNNNSLSFSPSHGNLGQVSSDLLWCDFCKECHSPLTLPELLKAKRESELSQWCDFCNEPHNPSTCPDLIEFKRKLLQWCDFCNESHNPFTCREFLQAKNKPPLESKFPTFEDDSQSNYDHLDPYHTVHKVDLSVVRNDIQGVTSFIQNLEGDEEATPPFTHLPFIFDEHKESLNHNTNSDQDDESEEVSPFNLKNVDEDTPSIFKVSQPIYDDYPEYSSEDCDQLVETINFENNNLVANEVMSHNASVEIILPKPSLVHNDVRPNAQQEPNICAIVSNDRIPNPRQKTFPEDDNFSIREPFPRQSICEPCVTFGFGKLLTYAKNATDSIEKGTKHNAFNDDADCQDDHSANPIYDDNREPHPLTVGHASTFDSDDSHRFFEDFIWQSWIEHHDKVIQANQSSLGLHLHIVLSSSNQFQVCVTKPFVTVVTYSAQSVDRSCSRNENDNPIDLSQYPKHHPP